MNSFKMGDVVRLKSGGPRMTIDRIVGETCTEDLDITRTVYQCIWFEGSVLRTNDHCEDSLILDETKTIENTEQG